MSSPQTSGSEQVPRTSTRRSGRRPSARPRTVAIRRGEAMPKEIPLANPPQGGRWLFLVLGVLLAVTVIGTLYFVLFHRDVELADARSALSNAQNRYLDALRALDKHNLEMARSDKQAAEQYFHQIGEDPRLRDEKAKLRGDLEKLQSELVPKVERDMKVEINYQNILQRLAQVADDKASDGDSYITLKRDMDRFCQNPVDPGTDVAAPELVATYQSYVDEVSRRKPMVEKGISDEARIISVNPTKQLQADVERRVREEKFGEAEERIESIANRFPEAKVDPVRQYLDTAMSTAWGEVTTYVTVRYADYETAGLDANFRIQRLREAQARLDRIIQTWGKRDYIAKAKELRAKYP